MKLTMWKMNQESDSSKWVVCFNYLDMPDASMELDFWFGESIEDGLNGSTGMIYRKVTIRNWGCYMHHRRFIRMILLIGRLNKVMVDVLKEGRKMKF